jgi:hypothetical protein
MTMRVLNRGPLASSAPLITPNYIRNQVTDGALRGSSALHCLERKYDRVDLWQFRDAINRGNYKRPFLKKIATSVLEKSIFILKHGCIVFFTNVQACMRQNATAEKTSDLTRL